MTPSRLPHPERIYRFEGRYEFLSNFHWSTITVNDLIYPTVEHYFQSCKATDFMEATAIRLASTPGEAKRLGRKCRMRAVWDDIKEDVMRTGVTAKFQDPELRDRLVETDPLKLVEGNHWHDQVWGDCYCGRPQCVPRGQNLLGIILMDTRQAIIDGWDTARSN